MPEGQVLPLRVHVFNHQERAVPGDPAVGITAQVSHLRDIVDSVLVARVVGAEAVGVLGTDGPGLPVVGVQVGARRDGLADLLGVPGLREGVLEQGGYAAVVGLVLLRPPLDELLLGGSQAVLGGCAADVGLDADQFPVHLAGVDNREAAQDFDFPDVARGAREAGNFVDVDRV